MMFGFKNWFKRTIIPEPSAENFFESGLRKGLSDKDYARAVNDLTEAIKDNSCNGDAYFHRGLFKRNLSDYEGSEADLTKAIEFLPDTEQAYFNRALTRTHLNDYSGVIADLTVFIEISQAKEIGYCHRAAAKDFLKDHKGAMSDYTTAIEIDPKFASAYYGRGYVQFELGHKHSAYEDLKRAAELGLEIADSFLRQYIIKTPEDLYIIPITDTDYYKRGNAKLALQIYDGAVDDFAKAIEIDPDYIEAYCERAMAYYELWNYNNAMKDYSKALELDPRFAKAYQGRGFVWIALGKYQEGVADFSRAIEYFNQSDKKAESYLLRGQANLLAGLKDSGCADLLKAKNLGNQKAKEKYQRHCLVDPESDEALLADAFNEIVPEDEKNEPFLVSVKPEFSNFTDPRDGADYKTVKIGRQTWMAENFKYMPHVCPVDKNDGIWVYDYNGYDVNEAKSLTSFHEIGCLYSFEAALKLCPKGWHMPTSDEWATLVRFLGGEALAEYKLRSRSGWAEPNIEITNESGFSGLPGGYRETIPMRFMCRGKYGFWWGFAEQPQKSPMVWSLGQESEWWNRGLLESGNDTSANYGYSVRFVKDVE